MVLTLPQALVIFELVRENMPVRGLGVDRLTHSHHPTRVTGNESGYGVFVYGVRDML